MNSEIRIKMVVVLFVFDFLMWMCLIFKRVNKRNTANNPFWGISQLLFTVVFIFSLTNSNQLKQIREEIYVECIAKQCSNNYDKNNSSLILRQQHRI